MAATNYAQIERAALCDLLVSVGPDAATLNEGWSTRDLVAHLVVRENRFDAALGLVIPFLAAHGESVRKKTAQRPYEELVAEVRAGPPKLSPMRIDAFDRATNTMEFFIHHEDVRRARPGWEPRELDASFETALGATIARFSKLAVRKAPTGIALVPQGGERKVVKQAEPMVELRAPVGELVLFVSGRGSHARVEFVGAPDACAAVQAADFGI